MFVDTHAHLFYPDYGEELDEVIRRSRDSGVDAILVPATDIASSAHVLELVKKYDFVYGAVGVHPHDSSEWDESFIPAIEKLAKEHERIVAIGEIGLDYYYDYSPKEKQIAAFRDQIELALKLDMPVIIHNRDSNEDVMEITREYCQAGLKAQYHCFAGSPADAQELARRGQFISFTGNVTFKKAESVREAAKATPLQNLLIETDSPFLTPAPHRGKRNEPTNVRVIAEKIAELHGVRVEDVARITSFNAFRLFGIGGKPKASATYQIHDNLYVNVTNRCNANCVFCRRKDDPQMAGHYLGMSKQEEPSAADYLEEIGNPTKFNEIVFVGYGEPTIRWELVREVAKAVKERGGATRLDTNGHGNVINHRDITPEMSGIIDKVSISLNATDAKQYAALMRLDESYYEEMKDFARKAKEAGVEVIMSVVGMDEIDVEAARKIAEEELGAEFRERAYF